MAAGLLACSAVVVAPSARADPAVCASEDLPHLNVYVVSASGTTCTNFTASDLSQLLPGQSPRSYSIRQNATQTVPPTQPIPEATPIDAVIRAVIGTPDAVTYSTVQSPTSRYRSPLSADTDDFADPSTVSGTYPFENGSQPVFFGDTGTLFYLRPIRVDDPSDVNSVDFISTATSMAVTIHTSGRLLKPTATARVTNSATGEVQFTSVVHDPDPTESVSWTWYFNSGPPSGMLPASSPDTNSTTHAYAPGSYGVVVQVVGTAADGVQTSYGAATVYFTVPPRPGKSSTSPTNSPSPGKSSSVGGAGRTTAPPLGPVDGGGTEIGGVPTAGGDPVTGGASGVPSSVGAGSSGSAGRTGAPTSGNRSGAPVVADGDRVVGYVLAGPAAGQAGVSAASSQAAGAPAVRASAPAGGHLALGGLFGALGVVCLLVLGVGAELRRPLRAARRRR